MAWKSCAAWKKRSAREFLREMIVGAEGQEDSDVIWQGGVKPGLTRLPLV